MNRNYEGKCIKCKEKLEAMQISEKSYCCDLCRRVLCEECAEETFTTTEIRVLRLKKERALKYFCDPCLAHIINDISTAQSNKHGIQEEVKLCVEKIELLYDKVEKNFESLNKKLVITSTDQHKNTKVECAEIEERKKYSDIVLIKPKKVQNSAKTKAFLEEKVDPGSIKQGVTQVKYIKEGGVAIRCGWKQGEDLTTVSESIRNQIGSDYEIIVPKKKNPKIKIVNVEEKLVNNKEEFIEKIILQNGITNIDLSREVTWITNYKGKLGKETVVLEVDPNTYVLMQQKEKLSIGWKSYRFFDHINIVQCFKCCKFGHMAKECRSEKVICLKCAGEHRSHECQSKEIVCANCKHAADILKIPNISFSHYGYDKNCEVFKKTYREAKLKVNYPCTLSKQK